METCIKFTQTQSDTNATVTITNDKIIECKRESVLGWDSFPSSKITATIISKENPFTKNDSIIFYHPRPRYPLQYRKQGEYYLDNCTHNGDGTITLTMYDISYKLNKSYTHGDFFCGQTFEEAIHNLLTWCGYDWKTSDSLSDCRNIYKAVPPLIDRNNPYRDSKLYGVLEPQSVKSAISSIALSLGLRPYISDSYYCICFRPLSYRGYDTAWNIDPDSEIVGRKYLTEENVDFIEIKQDYNWDFDASNKIMHTYNPRTMPDFYAGNDYESHKYFNNYYWLNWADITGDTSTQYRYSVVDGWLPRHFDTDPENVPLNPSKKPSCMSGYYFHCDIDTPASSVSGQIKVQNQFGKYTGCGTTSIITYPYNGEVRRRWKNYNLQSYTQNIGVWNGTNDSCSFYSAESLAKDLYAWLNPTKIITTKIYYPSSYDAVELGGFLSFNDENGDELTGIVTEHITDYTKSRDITEVKIRVLNDQE